MKFRHMLFVGLCILLALSPLSCSPGTGTVRPTLASPGRSPLPSRPTLTPQNPAIPSPGSQPTTSVQPTSRPASDPATTLFERDYGSQGAGIDDAFIAQYGQALVVLVALPASLQYQVINLVDGWEAAFTNPLEYMLEPENISVQEDHILIAGYEMLANPVALWKMTMGTEPKTVATIDNPDAGVIHLAFSPDGKTLAVGYANGEIRLYRTSDGAQQRAIQAHTGWVMSLSFSWDGRYLLSDSESFDPNTRVYNASSGALVATLSEESWNPVQPFFSPDGSLVAAVSDAGTHIFTTKDWRRTGEMLSVFGGSFACDGSAFWVDLFDQTEVYSMETGKLERTLDYGSLYCLTDGRTVVIDMDYVNDFLAVRIVSP